MRLLLHALLLIRGNKKSTDTAQLSLLDDVRNGARLPSRRLRPCLPRDDGTPDGGTAIVSLGTSQLLPPQKKSLDKTSYRGCLHQRYLPRMRHIHLQPVTMSVRLLPK